MNKKFQKTFSSLISLSIIASAAIMPVSAGAEVTPGITVNGNLASVSSDVDGVALVASYDENGILKSLTTKDIQAGATENVKVKLGDKVMLWSGGIDGMKAHIPSVEVKAPEVVETQKFDFGASDAAAEGYTVVSADKKYNADDGYGFLGLENGFAQDARDDGWTMTQGYDLVLENGKRDNVETADDDFVACTYDETVGNIGMVSPIRFAVKSEPKTYYKIKVKLVRADVTKEANVSLFTEKRHQHLVNEPIPETGLEYEASVYVHNNWSKSTYEYVDTMLNISAIGENAAISSVEVNKLASPGKTLWILGDSTVCEQTAAIPYFPLDHCQGVGSAMAKYLGKDWALVNEAESGLSASASKNHFNNMVNDIKPGDVVWFEFGHNDDKVTNDPSTNGYLTTLESYYNQVTEKGASFIAVAPIDRDTSGQYNAETNTWSSTLSHYASAAKNFVDTKISEGAENIAFIDLNAPTINFLDEISKEITDAGYSYGANATRFYYYVSKDPNYKSDYTHPNDYGADNFAHMFVEEGNKLILNAAEENADNSVKLQADILSDLLYGQRNGSAARVPKSIYSLGAPANEAYPNPLIKAVYYDYPWLISNAVFDDDGYITGLKGKSVPCKDISSVYGRGVMEVYNSDSTLKGKVISSGEVAFYDSSINGEQNLTFADKTVAYNADAGETYKIYVTDIDQSGNESDMVVSNTLTEKDNLDIKEYLMQGAVGTENKEDFSSYSSLATGSSIIGTNGWSSAGDVIMTLESDNDIKYAAVSKSSITNSHYVYRNFAPVTSGKLLVRFDIRYHEGVMTFELTNSASAPNSFPPSIVPVTVKTVDSMVGVYLADELVANINKDEWVTLQYIIDMDNAEHTLSVNGSSKTKEVPALAVNTVPSPAQLGTFAIIETKKNTACTYDITNIVVATLNTQELPAKTLNVISDVENSVEVTTAAGDAVTLPAQNPMNTVYKLKAKDTEGYKFINWIDADTEKELSTSQEYTVRAHTDLNIKAVYEAYTGPELIFEENGNGAVNTILAGGASNGNAKTDIWSFSGYTWGYMAICDTLSNAVKKSGFEAKDGQFIVFAANGGLGTTTGVSNKTLSQAGVFETDIAPINNYSNNGTADRGNANTSLSLCDTNGTAVLTFAYDVTAHTMSVNGEVLFTYADNVTAQKWSHIKAVINAEHTSAQVTYTPGTGDDAVTKTVELSSQNGYNTIKVVANATWGAVAVDNLTLYVSDEN